MRIGINARFLLQGKLEGIGGYSLEILKKMVEAHPEDEFIFFFDRPYSDEFILAKNIIPVVLFPPARHPFLWYLWFEWAIPYGLKKYKCDVFFSPDNYLSLRTKTPTVLVAHDIAFKHFTEGTPKLNIWYLEFFNGRFYQKAKKILTVSTFVKEDLIKFYDLKADKIDITYNGCKPIFKPLSIDNQTIVKEKYSKGKPYFFYVGAVHPRKNVHRLIAAFDIFKAKTNTEHQLLIAGRFAWQTGEVKSAYEQATYKNDIVFLNYIDNDSLAQLMASAFALTYISLFEGFGVPLIEAMNCDVPVITANVSSMPEVAGDAGLCVSPTDTSAIADAMISLYENPDLRQQLILKGRVQREKFDWGKSAEIVYRSLKEVVASI
jgi:glycosyltransferase involved in cell wall biosynthesis